MFCAKCGQRLADTVRFCPACGAPTANANMPEPESKPIAEIDASAIEPEAGPSEFNTNDFEDAVDQYDFGTSAETSAPAVPVEPVYEEPAPNTFVYDQPDSAEDDVIEVEPSYANSAQSRRYDFENEDAAYQFDAAGYSGEPVRYEKYRNPNGKAVASIVLGIVSIILCWVPFVPVITGIIGLICGIVNGKKKTGSSLHVAGITLSIIGLVIGALITAAYVILFMWLIGAASPVYENAGSFINSAFGNVAYNIGSMMR